MAHARAVQPLNESTGLRPPSVRSPRVQPVSAQSATGCVAALGSHRSAQKCLESSHERDRRDERSGAASSLASSVPTSGPSGRRCSTCVCGTSSATLLLPTQWSVCCIDQLNPPSLAVLRSAKRSRSSRCDGSSTIIARRHEAGLFDHWITSSARARSDRETLSPSDFAVFMLMISSNFVGCSIGRSTDLAPLRILSTYAADRPTKSLMLIPYETRPPASTFPH